MSASAVGWEGHGKCPQRAPAESTALSGYPLNSLRAQPRRRSETRRSVDESGHERIMVTITHATWPRSSRIFRPAGRPEDRDSSISVQRGFHRPPPRPFSPPR